MADSEKTGFDERDLEGIQLFKNVHLASIKGLIDVCRTQVLEPGAVLISPGRLNKKIYFVMEGSLRVHLESPESEPIATLGPGESVGEISVIDNQAASAYVVADERCRLLVMEEDVLWSLIQASHAAACNLLFVLAKRLRQTDCIIVEGAQLEQDFQHYGSVDALTGLHNRYWFDTVYKRQFARSIASGRPFSLIMADIDHFKEVNDTYGHLVGDRVLYSIARIITNYIRATEVVARYGGDEFVIILADQGLDTARTVAERLLLAARDALPIRIGDKTITHPTLSVGIAEINVGESPDELIRRADEALYRSKIGGRDCVAD
ncbi:MAG TPA: GGDEF domain-containing protein [Syntrophorhabdaceae bacterium]|nr:GGDEF domain-containing protein [Syntrophorhabdaceae bacterium]